MTIGFTQPITADIYPEGSVGARALGVTHKLSARGKSQGGTTGADVDFSNLVNDLDKLKADAFQSIAGLIISNNSGDSDHDIDITPGACADSTNALSMFLASAITKRIDANWAEGTNQGGFPSALTLSVGWYHVFIILKIDVEADTYTVDAGFDTSITATSLLSDATGYTHYRRIGSVLPDGSLNINPFSAIELAGGGVDFQWTTRVLNLDDTTPSTSVLSFTLTTPQNLISIASIVVHLQDSAGAIILITATDETDSAPGTNFLSLYAEGGSTSSVVHMKIKTNTSRQIRYRSDDASVGIFKVWTKGWIDNRTA